MMSSSSMSDAALHAELDALITRACRDELPPADRRRAIALETESRRRQYGFDTAAALRNAA